MKSVSDLAAETFLVAGRRIDASANVVEWRGETVHLEPRVMQLLLYLAAHQGHVASRVDLEDEVWTGTVVGYDALTQTVSKLRKALEDDPRNPRIIETVSKSGYRLIATIEPDAPTFGEKSAEPIASAPKELTPERVAAAGIAIRRRRSQVFAVMLALTVVTAVSIVWVLHKPDAVNLTLLEPASLTVLPFENLSGDKEWDYLGDALTEDVTTAFAAETAIHVLAPHTVLGTEGRDSAPTILTRSTGARYLIEGSIQGNVKSPRINVRLTDTSTNRHLWAKRYELPFENVFPVVDDIARQVIPILLPNRSTAATLHVVKKDPVATSGLSYHELIESPNRRKCFYGNVAQVSGDHAAAARIFEDCIERWNDVRSMIALAHILELGVGVPQDLPRAFMLLQRGAYTQDSAGYASLARYHYGIALLQGKGLGPSSTEGFKWLQRAAAEGVEDARRYLARNFAHQVPGYHGDRATETP